MNDFNALQVLYQFRDLAFIGNYAPAGKEPQRQRSFQPDNPSCFSYCMGSQQRIRRQSHGAVQHPLTRGKMHGG